MTLVVCCYKPPLGLTLTLLGLFFQYSIPKNSLKIPAFSNRIKNLLSAAFVKTEYQKRPLTIRTMREVNSLFCCPHLFQERQLTLCQTRNHPISSNRSRNRWKPSLHRHSAGLPIRKTTNSIVRKSGEQTHPSVHNFAFLFFAVFQHSHRMRSQTSLEG